MMFARRALAFLLTATMFNGCSNERAAVQPRDGCHRQLGKESWFIGTVECMRKLPQTRFSGVWVLGMEHSIFYEGVSRVPAKALTNRDPRRVETEVWLDTDPEDLMERRGHRFDGYTRAYRVEFMGAKSDALGVYGHGGMFRHGVLMKQLLKVEQIPLK